MKEAEVRFEFGANWDNYLQQVSSDRLEEAKKSLKDAFECNDLMGKKFLDIGSGSGIFSLAAVQLGAYVHSFDYDINSVACAQKLKKKYNVAEERWKIEQGSVLDSEYLNGLPKFDFVYSWGVLHHTGQMWRAIEFATMKVAPHGRLCIAIYNYQRRYTRLWTFIKASYCEGSWLRKKILLIGVGVFLLGPSFVRDLLILKPFNTYRQYKRHRGMSQWHDLIDWVGGFPFEAASPDEIFRRVSSKKFRLLKLKTCGGGHGCNEFTFVSET